MENKIKPIASFLIDHTKHKQGFYLTKIDELFGHKVYTYDLRFRKPNNNDYLDNAVIHSIEHLLASAIRSGENGGLVLYFGPMGCRTGFDMLLVDIDYEKAKKLLLKAIDVVEDIDTLPGASEKECGNYKEHDLEAAKQELKKYKEIIE